MSTNPSDVDRVRTAVAKSLHGHWKLFLVEGIILLGLGLTAVVLPPIATFAVEIVIGWLLLISGIVGLITTLRMSNTPGRSWSLISAILGIAAGIVLLRWPLSSTISLTLILSVFFLIEGIASIFYALEHRRELSRRWSWMLFSGVIDLILASSIFVGLPGTAAWAIGLLVGINMVFGGLAVIAMALNARAITAPA
jgi:uncharacterized membrane protein HdeD (DUF308 family)